MAVANDGSVADNCANNIDSSVIGKGFSFGNGENGSLGDVKGHTVFHGDISGNGGISDNLALIMLEVGVILRVKLAVVLAADFANRPFGTGGFSAGTILCFKPVAAVHGAFAGVRAVAV